MSLRINTEAPTAKNPPDLPAGNWVIVETTQHKFAGTLWTVAVLIAGERKEPPGRYSSAINHIVDKVGMNTAYVELVHSAYQGAAIVVSPLPSEPKAQYCVSNEGYVTLK